MEYAKKAVKKVLLSLAFPVLMFVVMLVITMNSDKCFVNGHNIFLGKDMVKQVVINSCMTVCVALAIWLQLKNGRFDFSGGASMVLAAIGAGYAGQQTGSMWTAFAVAVALGVVLSMGTAIVYIVGRLPIIICTIGTWLLQYRMNYAAERLLASPDITIADLAGETGCDYTGQTTAE